MFQRALQSVTDIISSGIKESHYLCNEGAREGFEALQAAARLTTIAIAMVEDGPPGLATHSDRLLSAVQEKNWRLTHDILCDSARQSVRLQLGTFELPMSEGHCEFAGVSAPAGFRS